MSCRCSKSDPEVSSRQESSSRAISRDAPKVDLKDTDYFSFSEIYSAQDHMEERATLESKNGDTVVNPTRSDCSNDQDEQSNSSSSRMVDQPANKAEMLAASPKQQQPVPAKKGGFFSFLGKSKSSVVSY